MPAEDFLVAYETPTAIVVAGIPGRATLGALKDARAVCDDYSKRTRNGLTEVTGAPFRFGVHVFGDLAKPFASADLEVDDEHGGWLLATGPKATARSALESATGKPSAAKATAKKPATFDAAEHAMETCILVAGA